MAVEMPEQPGSPFDGPDVEFIGVGECDAERPSAQAPEKTHHSPVRSGQHGAPAPGETREGNRPAETPHRLRVELPASDAAAFVPAEKAVIQEDATNPVRVRSRPEAPEGGQAVLHAHIDENAAQVEQNGRRKGIPVRTP